MEFGAFLVKLVFQNHGLIEKLTFPALGRNELGLDSLELSIEIDLGMLIVDGVGLKLLSEYFRLVFEFADVIFHL